MKRTSIGTRSHKPVLASLSLTPGCVNCTTKDGSITFYATQLLVSSLAETFGSVGSQVLGKISNIQLRRKYFIPISFLRLFYKYLLDADFSVCAGNWMWVSSSAFEQVLNCSVCINPTQFGQRVEPLGDYVRRHIPELSNMPVEYIYEPWKAPPEVQEKAGCIIGKDYPAPIVDHKTVSRSNCQRMNAIKENLMKHLNKVSDEIFGPFFFFHPYFWQMAYLTNYRTVTSI